MRSFKAGIYHVDLKLPLGFAAQARSFIAPVDYWYAPWQVLEAVVAHGSDMFITHQFLVR